MSDGPQAEDRDAAGGEYARDPEAVANLVWEHLIEEAITELDRPHLVICTHTATGVSSYQGPYRDALAAAIAAQQDQDCLTGPDGVSALRFTVAPLLEVEARDVERPTA